MAFNPSTNQLMLAQMGLGFGSGLMQGNAQKNMNRDNQLTGLAQLIAQIQQAENQNRLSATQMDPLLQQRSRANFAAEGDVMKAARPVEMQFSGETGMGSLSGGMAIPQGGFSDHTKGFYAPEAAASAEAEFYGAAGMPYDLASKGYGDSARNASMLLAQRLADRPNPAATLQSRYDTLNNSGGGGGSWWKTALGIGAPLAMNFLLPGSGFLASGLGKALVGAGTGALTGGLTGGTKGALTGAGQGAMSSILANQLARIGGPKAPPVNTAPPPMPTDPYASRWEAYTRAGRGV
jgi:hypothetical protein